jgi:hypothetical protein
VVGDHLEEIGRADALGDVAVGARLAHEPRHGGLVLGREVDDERALPRVFLEPPGEDLDEAVALQDGQVHIHEDEIAAVAEEDVVEHSPVRGRDEVVLFLEELPHAVDEVRVVVHDHDALLPPHAPGPRLLSRAHPAPSFRAHSS